ncbi:hypothetical protein [Lysobacter gummosus]
MVMVIIKMIQRSTPPTTPEIKPDFLVILFFRPHSIEPMVF